MSAASTLSCMSADIATRSSSAAAAAAAVAYDATAVPRASSTPAATERNIQPSETITTPRMSVKETSNAVVTQNSREKSPCTRRTYP